MWVVTPKKASLAILNLQSIDSVQNLVSLAKLQHFTSIGITQNRTNPFCRQHSAVRNAGSVSRAHQINYLLAENKCYTLSLSLPALRLRSDR